MNFEDLKSPEFQEKLKAAKTPAELLALAKEQGYPLSDEELQKLVGGKFRTGWGWESGRQCPRCLSTSITTLSEGHWRCNDCGKEWNSD